MMKSGIIGKTMTSNGKNVFGKNFVVFYEHVQSNYMVNELDFGLEDPCARYRTRQTTCKHDNETAALA